MTFFEIEWIRFAGIWLPGNSRACRPPCWKSVNGSRMSLLKVPARIAAVGTL
jgi:hypothetical protein